VARIGQIRRFAGGAPRRAGETWNWMPLWKTLRFTSFLFRHADGRRRQYGRRERGETGRDRQTARGPKTGGPKRLEAPTRERTTNRTRSTHPVNAGTQEGCVRIRAWG